jgi:hypothetical protein
MSSDGGGPQIIYDGWKRNPNQEIWLIDETKYELNLPHKEHGEIIAFSIVRLQAAIVTAYMEDIDEKRNALPGDKQRNFKSGTLWRIFRQATNPSSAVSPSEEDDQPELAQFISVIVNTLVQCKDIGVLISTHKNIADDSHTGKITSIAEDGTARINESKQLNLVNNLILRLMDLWSIKDSVDIVIDRSQALGLDPQQEGISKNQFRMHCGRLKTGTPEIRMIAASDTNISFRDLLLLPDFFGYLVRKYRSTNIDRVLPDILSRRNLHYLVPFDLPAMIAAIRTGESAQ